MTLTSLDESCGPEWGVKPLSHLQLIADAGPLRQALQDIEDAEGPEVSAQCSEALRIMLEMLHMARESRR